MCARFTASNPKVSLYITLNDRMVDLVDEVYDAAIRITNLASSQLVSRRLATTRSVCCASPGYLATHGAPVHPHELADHQVISYTRSEERLGGKECVSTCRFWWSTVTSKKNLTQTTKH